MADNKTKSEAEVRYAKAQRRVQDAAKAMNEVEAEAQRVAVNTARLKALRLAKEAADLAAAAAAKPAAKKTKKSKTAARS